MNHAEKIEHARALALQKAPYYASVIYGFIYEPVDGAGTMFCTERMVLGYHIPWVEIASVEELAFDLAHECNHFLRRTFERGRHVADKKLFNLAADLPINADLRAAGWKAAEGPMGAVFAEMLGLPPDRTTEEYYDLLIQKQAKGGWAPPEGGVCSGRCGGLGAHKAKEAVEETLDKSDLGRTDVEMQGIAKRAAGDIKRHYEGKGRGTMPGYLKELIDTANKESYVRWEDELAQVIRDATGNIISGGSDFSFARPSKRSYMRGIVRPGLIEHVPEVGIVVDSSGSMGKKQLVRAGRESAAIMQGLGIDEIWYCEADAGVALEWQRVTMDYFRTFKIHGRGGTDFRPAIEAAQKLHPPIDLLAYLTDGDGTAPDKAPSSMQVVWGIVPSYYNKAPASWGHPVFISDDPKVRNRKTKRPGQPDEDDDDDLDDDVDSDDDS